MEAAMSAQTLEHPAVTWAPDPPPPAGEPPTAHPDPGPAPPAPPGGPAGGVGASGRHGWRRRLVTGAAIAALGLGSGVAGGYAATGLEDHPATTVVATPASTQATGGSSLASVAAAVTPTVVSITVQTAGGQVEGSGVILTSDGLIVTNNHVVEDAAGGGRITVQLSDGRTVAANVVGTDPATDLAVVKAQGVSGLKAATLGDSDALEVGDTVLAVGNSLGLEGSVTAGIVSALHRGVDTAGSGGALSDAIQTDASINPGNSGGPLVNAAGQVVGITTANATVSQQSSGSIGVGFAIPSNRVKQVVNQLTGGGIQTVSATSATG
jgi:putative serine protease PepD